MGLELEVEGQSRYLAAVVESASDAIVGKDLNGIITIWNQSAAELFGYTRDEMVGHSILELIPEDRVEEERSILERVRQGISVNNLETTRIRKDGRAIRVTITVSPIQDESGQIIGAAKTVRGMSDREWEARRFLSVTDAVGVAIIILDVGGRICMANVEAESLFGYRREELIGGTVEKLVPEALRPRHGEWRKDFSEKAVTRRMGPARDVQALKADGTEFPVEVGLSTMETNEGVFIVASVVDITQRKLAEMKLQCEREALERSNRDLEQFAFAASHDLQEPLRAVAGFVQLLQRRYGGQLDARADEFIEHAVDGCKRMQSLIDDLFVYARIGIGGHEMKTVDMQEVVTEARLNLLMKIRESGCELIGGTHALVRGEFNHLLRLFENLVANCIKFRRPGEPLRVAIEAKRQANFWEFTVADNGIGIAPEHFERIFQVFQRLHTRTKYPGTGIGLAICKRIVELHGGEIWLESEQGKGATFHFTLPAAD